MAQFLKAAAGRPLIRDVPGLAEFVGLRNGIAPCTIKVEHMRCMIPFEGSMKRVVFVDTPAFPDPGLDLILDWWRQT